MSADDNLNTHPLRTIMEDIFSLRNEKDPTVLSSLTELLPEILPELHQSITFPAILNVLVQGIALVFEKSADLSRFASAKTPLYNAVINHRAIRETFAFHSSCDPNINHLDYYELSDAVRKTLIPPNIPANPIRQIAQRPIIDLASETATDDRDEREFDRKLNHLMHVPAPTNTHHSPTRSTYSDFRVIL
jgi:hypothetical protein